jgi:hypothetical protein
MGNAIPAPPFSGCRRYSFLSDRRVYAEERCLMDRYPDLIFNFNVAPLDQGAALSLVHTDMKNKAVMGRLAKGKTGRVPIEAQHLRKAQHNEAFLATFDLAATPYLDWAVTATFYTALHYLRALMAKDRYTNISNYGDVDQAFNKIDILKRHPGINDDYRSFKDDSWSARYNMWSPRPPDVVDLRDNELQRIRDFVLANL